MVIEKRSSEAVVDRNVGEELCATKEAVAIASSITGYKVDGSTLQQAVSAGRVHGATIANVMYYQKKSLRTYAERLRDDTSRTLKKKAHDYYSALQREPKSVVEMLLKLIKKGAN